MNAKQRRTWYRALRPTMQAIVLHARITDTEMMNGAGFAGGSIRDWTGWTAGQGEEVKARRTPRWRLTQTALHRQKATGMVWNAKR